MAKLLCEACKIVDGQYLKCVRKMNMAARNLEQYTEESMEVLEKRDQKA